MGGRRDTPFSFTWSVDGFVSVGYNSHEAAGKSILHYLSVHALSHVYTIASNLAIFIPAHTAANDHKEGGFTAIPAVNI